MATQTFELVSPFLTIYAPSKKFLTSQASLLLGQTTNRLVAGELLTLTGANGTQRSAYAQDTNLAVPSFPYFSETGRGDIVTGGNVPILQFGPFEADTMCFERHGDAGNLGGSLAAGHINGLAVGTAVYALAVRNPLNGNLSNTDYIYGVGTTNSNGHRIGYVSRITGTGATQKVRVLFGL